MVLAQAVAVGQTTYYVATDGSDTNTGTTLQAPLRSLQRAMDLVGPGDTVLMRGGTYREHVTFRTNGTPSQPITIQAVSNEIPVLKGSAPVTGWTLHTGRIWQVSGWTNWSQQVFVDDMPLQMIGRTRITYYQPVGLDANDLYPGSFYVDTNTATLLVWLADGGAPTGRLVEAGVGDYKAVLRVGHHYRVEGLHIRHANVIVDWPAVILSQGSHMRNCHITHNDVAGVMVSDNAILEQCVIANNGVVGVQSLYTNITIRGNLIYSNNVRGFDFDNFAGGIKLYATGTARVESNQVFNNFCNGIWVDFCRDDSLKRIHANHVYGNRSHPRSPGGIIAGIDVEISRHVRVDNNLVSGNTVVGIRVAESDSCEVLNNTITGTEGFAGLMARLSERYVPIDQYMERIPGNYEYATLTNNLIANNLLYANDVDHDLLWLTNNPLPAAGVSANHLDHNLFFNPATGIVLQVGETWTNLSAYSAATGFGSNSLAINPRLAAPFVGDFRASHLSPVIDAGLIPPSIADEDDLDGHPRHQFASVDIGCYEFNGSAEAIAPSITIQTPAGVIPYTVTNLTGWNNANVEGMIWAEVLSGTGPPVTGVVTRTDDSFWRLDSPTFVVGIAYTITVYGTNLNGVVASDTVSLERGGLGTGPPALTITTPAPMTTLDTWFSIAGTNNPHVLGALQWRNEYTGQTAGSGTVPRTGATWSVTATNLQVGLNHVVITATNAWGEPTSVTAVVHQGETPIHYVATNAATPTYPFFSPATAARTVQDAVDAATDGDRVVVAPGLYDQGGRDHPMGYARVVVEKAIVLESEQGPETTILWGYKPGGPAAVRGALLAHTGAVLRGFTLQNGVALGLYPKQRKHGGGLLVVDALEVSTCRFVNNEALPYGSGGGAAFYNAHGRLVNCTFISNRAESAGGCAILFGDHTEAERLVAYGNSANAAGGGFVIDNCSRFHSALAYDNTAGTVGGGFNLANNVQAWNLTAENNLAELGGGGLSYAASNALVANAIIWSNHPDAVYVASNQASQVMMHSLVPGPFPTAVQAIAISAVDPQYEDPSARMYRPGPDSPALDFGSNRPWLVSAQDLDGRVRKAGPRVDAGAYERGDQLWITPSADAYYTGSSSWIRVTLDWAADRALDTYTLHLNLPEGWQLSGISSAAPVAVVSPTQIVLQAAFTAAPPLDLDLRLDVPPTATGMQSIAIHHQYQLTDMDNAVSVPDAGGLTFDNYKFLDLGTQGDGFVALNSGWYVPETELTLNAYANPGWRFRGWLGDTTDATTNAGDSITLRMDQHRTIDADFVRLIMVTVTSVHDAVEPTPGTFIVDEGSLVTLTATNTVLEQGTSYVAAAWTGTGDLPATGYPRTVSTVVTQDTSLTWIWLPLAADQAATGYRTHGQRTTQVTIQAEIPDDPLVHRVWCHPLLPSGGGILGGDGLPPPVLTSNQFLVIENPAPGQTVTFSMNLRLPDEHTGPFPLSVEVGLNALPGEHHHGVSP